MKNIVLVFYILVHTVKYVSKEKSKSSQCLMSTIGALWVVFLTSYAT